MNNNDKLLIELCKFIRDNYQVEEKLPGERLLSKAMNASRSAIRERLIVLHERGFIRVQPQSGVYYAKEIKL